MTKLYLNDRGQLPLRLQMLASTIAKRIAAPNLASSIRARLAAYDGFAPTPLPALDRLAAELGIASLHVKDERERWNQGSFKALGGTYAVLLAAGFRAVGPDWIFATSSAGNHGRAVAFGATLVGAQAKIFLPRGVPAAQREAILRLGAEVILIPGDYERAGEDCRMFGAEEDWIVVADTALEDDVEMPMCVMQGYTVIALEALETLREPPSHVFLQAGVGSFAASQACFYAANLTPPPKCVIVEPETAPCLYETVRRLQSFTIPASQPSIMGRLQCRISSTLAWPVLARDADGFVTIDDDMGRRAAHRLADEGLVTTPSGAAGLAGLFAILENATAKQALGIDANSRVLITVTEQAPTDEENQ